MTKLRQPPAVAIGAIGSLIGIGIAALLLVAVGWDPSSLLRVGEEDRATVAFVEERLGDIVTVPEFGHDGKYFFVQATDPLVLEPSRYQELLARPVYRTQRMLYPLLASGFGLLDGWGIVWGLLAVNILAAGLGAWATARLAMSYQANSWLGLTFTLNPGMVFELVIDGSGALAWALAIAGIWHVREGRLGAAVALLAAGVLSREAMLLVGIGLAIAMVRTDRRRAITVAGVPLAVAVVWGGWTRFQMGVGLFTAQSEEFGMPFVGLVQAFPDWMDGGGRNLIFGFAALAVLLVAALQAAQRPSQLTVSTLGFVVLAPFLTRQVWLNYFDITRAIAPLYTTFVLAVFARPASDGLLGGMVLDRSSGSSVTNRGQKSPGSSRS